MLTSGEVAKWLRMNERTVHKLAKRGELPGVKVGRRWLFNRGLVEKWLADKVEEGKPMPAGSTYPAAPAPVRLTDSIHPASIKMELSGTDVPSVVHEMVGLATLSGAISDPLDLERRILERERHLSTGMDRGIAIPHPRGPVPDLGRQLLLSVGVCREGLDYQALDGGPTHLFFLVCARDESTHIRAVAKLAKILHSRVAVENLLDAKTAEDLIAEFSQLEHGG